jgi:hypothetical protein
MRGGYHSVNGTLDAQPPRQDERIRNGLLELGYGE